MGMQLSSNRTRLHLDGVGSAITADVTRRRTDGMVVSQPLPFLRLDTSVTERGRRSRIKRVAIAMDGDVPQLLLELMHEAGVSGDDTQKSFTPGMSERPARTDSTIPYGFDTTSHPASISVGDAIAMGARAPEPQPSWLMRTWHWMLGALTALG